MSDYIENSAEVIGKINKRINETTPAQRVNEIDWANTLTKLNHKATILLNKIKSLDNDSQCAQTLFVEYLDEKNDLFSDDNEAIHKYLDNSREITKRVLHQGFELTEKVQTLAIRILFFANNTRNSIEEIKVEMNKIKNAKVKKEYQDYIEMKEEMMKRVENVSKDISSMKNEKDYEKALKAIDNCDREFDTIIEENSDLQEQHIGNLRSFISKLY